MHGMTGGILALLFVALVVGFATRLDLTRRREAETTLQRAYDELDQRVQERSAAL